MTGSLSTAVEALVVSGAALGLVWYLRSRQQQQEAECSSPIESGAEKGKLKSRSWALNGGLPDPDPLHDFNLVSTNQHVARCTPPYMYYFAGDRYDPQSPLCQ